MCGRTASTLCKEDIQHATRQYSENLPKWIEKYPWQAYKPAYNIAPTNNLPVLLQEQLLGVDRTSNDLVIFPMRWGMIPHWFKGSSASESSNNCHNCRSETVLKRPTFRGSMLTGKRCIVLADGYYEWKSCGNGGKLPYFIYFSNENGIQMDQRTFQCEKFCSDDGLWRGPRLLTMAGIFDVWKSPQGMTIYSCSILTMESSKTVEHIHKRMPVILDGVEDVQSWINSREVSAEEAMSKIKSIEKLEFYPVKNVVNFPRNNTVECIMPLKNLRNDPGKPVQVQLDHLFNKMKNKRMKSD